MNPSSMVYDRLSGIWSIYAEIDDGGQERVVATGSGYAGAPGHVNRPGSSHLVGLGPVPPGEYHVGLPVKHPRLGPIAFRLRPKPGNVMFGRSGFMIHGDNGKGDRSASRGCIILNRMDREKVRECHVRHLTVT